MRWILEIRHSSLSNNIQLRTWAWSCSNSTDILVFSSCNKFTWFSSSWHFCFRASRSALEASKSFNIFRISDCVMCGKLGSSVTSLKRKQKTFIHFYFFFAFIVFSAHLIIKKYMKHYSKIMIKDSCSWQCCHENMLYIFLAIIM